MEGSCVLVRLEDSGFLTCDQLSRLGDDTHDKEEDLNWLLDDDDDNSENSVSQQDHEIDDSSKVLEEEWKCSEPSLYDMLDSALTLRNSGVDYQQMPSHTRKKRHSRQRHARNAVTSQCEHATDDSSVIRHHIQNLQEESDTESSEDAARDASTPERDSLNRNQANDKDISNSESSDSENGDPQSDAPENSDPFAPDEQSSEININNHKIPYMSKKEFRSQQLLKLTEQNFCLTAQNKELRNSIRCIRESAVAECSKILDAIIRYAECKANRHKKMSRSKVFSCDHNQDRFSSSCGTGICGGYTPSGWNKLLTKHSVDCCDPCCPFCCPPNRCPSPCPGAAEPCPCFRGKLSGPCSCPTCPRRKPKPQCKPVDSCNSRASPSSGADENCSGNCRPSAKILGEMAFQLERRILDYVFGLECTKRRRFYGYTVSNIVYMMEKEATTPKGNIDLQNKTETVARLKKILIALNKFGYDIKIHGDFAREMVNKYGLLACPPDSRTIDEFGLYDPSCIAKLIEQLALGPHEKKNLHILLKCLKYLSKCDGRPLFVW